jgi:peroxiredoxin
MHRATAELIASGAAGRAKKVSDKAPSFSLKGPEGNIVSSAELLTKGPLIVSFYRGVWCPYCNMELQALEAAKPEFEKFGASLVAISPQTQPNSRKSVRQNKLSFLILSDTKGEVGAAFGLRFQRRTISSSSTRGTRTTYRPSTATRAGPSRCRPAT